MKPTYEFCDLSISHLNCTQCNLFIKFSILFFKNTVKIDGFVGMNKDVKANFLFKNPLSPPPNYRLSPFVCSQGAHFQVFNIFLK